MKLQSLLTFAMVARLKSITRAAQQLNPGQSAVSGQLKLLQDAVGESLLGTSRTSNYPDASRPRASERAEREYREAKGYIRRLQ